MENWDCYWACEGEKEINGEFFPELYCYFDAVKPCEPCKICRYYVRYDKVDDYIRHLLEEIELLEKLP